MATAEVVIEGTYSVPMITHVCLETHGLTVKFEGDDKMLCWASTQNVVGVAGDLAGLMKLPPANVTVLHRLHGRWFRIEIRRRHLGPNGGRAVQEGRWPARQAIPRPGARASGAGNRPSASAHIKLGANRDGKLVAMIAEAHGTGGVGGGGNVMLPYVYSVPNTQVAQSSVLTNFGNQRAMRAPGHPQSCTLTEAAMDDLADKLGMDPLEFRLKNLSPTDFHTPIYEGELKIGAELIGWTRKTQAARSERRRPDQTRTRRRPASVGWRRRPWQESLVHHQLRWVGRDENCDPGSGYGDSHRACDHRRRDPGTQADRHHLEHRQLELSARASFGRLDHDADHGAAGLRRRDQSPRCVLQEDRPGRAGGT